MKDVLILLLHLLTTIAKLIRPSGARAVVADSLLMKQQLLVMSRSPQRAASRSALVRFLFGFWTLFLHPRRIVQSAVIIKPSNVLRFHEALTKSKYQRLDSSFNNGKPGPQGPSLEPIQVVVEMKQRNPGYGSPTIAQQINRAFGTHIDKDVVGRVLAERYRPRFDPNGGSSWLTFIGHMKESLWGVELFRCESILLKTHWVLIVMDQFTRRIVGLSVHAGDIDGVSLCCMLNKAISKNGLPQYLSSDNDPLFRYHRWQANLRILECQEVKSVPYLRLSHTLIERLIETLRHEFRDNVFFSNAIMWGESRSDFVSVITRIACTLRSMAMHRQKLLAKPPATVPNPTNTSCNLTAAGYTNYPQLLEQQLVVSHEKMVFAFSTSFFQLGQNPSNV